MENIVKIEKCVKEEKIVLKQIAFLRSDLVREVFKISYGIRYYFNDGSIKEEYFDSIFRESLQDGSTYYPNEQCNSYEEISNITHVSINRDNKYEEISKELEKTAR